MNKTNNTATHEGQSDGRRNRKTYKTRLSDASLPTLPAAPQVWPARQFQLAHLAATLAKDAAKDATATELVLRALRIWNASGRALLVEKQLDVLVKGLLCYNMTDWSVQANVLLDAFDDALDSLSVTEEQAGPPRLSASSRATEVLVARWSCANVDTDTVLEALFASRCETKETRRKQFKRLMSDTKTFMEKESTRMKESGQPSRANNPVRYWVELAWAPLDLGIASRAVSMARQAIESPEMLLQPGVLICPRLIRWLVVMRQEQSAAAKRRN